MSWAPLCTIELVGGQVGKGRPRFVRATGNVFTPARTRNYESDLRLAGQELMQGRFPFDGPVRLLIEVVLPIPRSWKGRKLAGAIAGTVMPTGKPDADNYAKSVGDTLNLVVWRDDSQIVSLSVLKVYGEKPRLTVSAEGWTAPVVDIEIPKKDLKRQRDLISGSAAY